MNVFLLIYHDASDYYVTNHSLIGVFSSAELASAFAERDRVTNGRYYANVEGDGIGSNNTHWYSITQSTVDSPREIEI